MRIKTVQLALTEPNYAAAISDLLTDDRMHRVLLADAPNPAIEGVIVIDSRKLAELPSLAKQPERLIVMVDRERDELSEMWDAGVRHVIFYGDPPQNARAMIMGLELALGANGSA